MRAAEKHLTKETLYIYSYSIVNRLYCSAHLRHIYIPHTLFDRSGFGSNARIQGIYFCSTGFGRILHLNSRGARWLYIYSATLDPRRRGRVKRAVKLEWTSRVGIDDDDGALWCASAAPATSGDAADLNEYYEIYILVYIRIYYIRLYSNGKCGTADVRNRIGLQL